MWSQGLTEKERRFLFVPAITPAAGQIIDSGQFYPTI